LAIGGLDTALTLQDAHASFRLPTPVLSSSRPLNVPLPSCNYSSEATQRDHAGSALSPTADHMLIIQYSADSPGYSQINY
jgi:hypothetical protein